MKKHKVTGRSKRMQHFKQLNSGSELNLVSMMDIFTILVFFLLVSTSSQNLPSNKNLKLPTTVSQKQPEETLIIEVTKDSILVQGIKVASVAGVLASNDSLIEPLGKELRFHASKVLLVQKTVAEKRAVTIMGDETIPYQLLKKILTTCSKESYTQIAFAAYQKSKSKK
jgi:biopolymer transport protein ExbD